MLKMTSEKASTAPVAAIAMNPEVIRQYDDSLK